MKDSLEAVLSKLDSTDREVVEAELAYRDGLTHEVRHRTKNNLRVIASILNIQARGLDDKKAVAALEDCQNRIYSMGVLYDTLCFARNKSNTVDAGHFIYKVARGVFSAQKLSDVVTLDVQAGNDIQMGVDTAKSYGLIVSDLISNALKHAFPDGGEGKVEVKFRDAGDKYELIVRDDGVGMPADFDLKKIKSLGLHLVNLALEQLDGELEIRGEKGTEVYITFPKE